MIQKSPVTNPMNRYFFPMAHRSNTNIFIMSMNLDSHYYILVASLEQICMTFHSVGMECHDPN